MMKPRVANEPAFTGSSTEAFTKRAGEADVPSSTVVFVDVSLPASVLDVGSVPAGLESVPTGPPDPSVGVVVPEVGVAVPGEGVSGVPGVEAVLPDPVSPDPVAVEVCACEAEVARATVASAKASWRSLGEIMSYGSEVWRKEAESAPAA